MVGKGRGQTVEIPLKLGQESQTVLAHGGLEDLVTLLEVENADAAGAAEEDDGAHVEELEAGVGVIPGHAPGDVAIAEVAEGDVIGRTALPGVDRQDPAIGGIDDANARQRAILQ
jgi:hypothetical protein